MTSLAGAANATGDSSLDCKKPNGSRPMANLSGKYATCTNKNETLNFQQTAILVTNRFNVGAGQTSGEVAVTQIESAREILLKKGSKCKCAVYRGNDFVKTHHTLRGNDGSYGDLQGGR